MYRLENELSNMQSHEVTESILNDLKNKKEIEVIFSNLNLSEEIRINSLLKDFKPSKPIYSKDFQTFTKIYKLN